MKRNWIWVKCWSQLYHPELDVAKQGVGVPDLPPVGNMVLFAADYEPRVGKVMELRPTLVNQVVVQLWKPRQPRRGRADISTAKFATLDSPEDPCQRAISLNKIRIRNLHLNDAGTWDPPSQSAVKKALRLWQRRHR